MTCFLFVGAFFLILGGQVCRGDSQTWYVDSNVSSGVGTKDKPFPDFREAFNAARTGDTILAKAGTYRGSQNSGMEIQMDGVAQITFGVDGAGSVVVDMQSETQTPFVTVNAPDPPETPNTLLSITGYTFVNNPYGMVLDIDSAVQLAIEDCVFENNGKNATDQETHVLRLLNTDFYSKGCDFTNNFSPFFGAAAFFSETSGKIEDSTFTENTVEKTDTDPDSDLGSGGALFIVGSFARTIPSIIESTFSSNSAYSGGAIHLVGGNTTGEINLPHHSLSLIDCLFEDNVAEYQGGGVFSLSNLGMERSTFVNNVAEYGGGLALVGGNPAIATTWINSSEFSGNSARNSGGALYYDSTVYLDLENSLFQNNSAIAGSGGAMWLQKPSCDFSSTTFVRNSAEMGNGGAIVAANNTFLNLNMCLFDSNSCGNYGGGLYALELTTGTMRDSHFINNVAEGEGGALRLQSDWTILSSNFESNHAQRGGAGSLDGDVHFLHFAHCNFDGNIGFFSGAALDISSSTSVFNHKPMGPIVNSMHIFSNNFTNNRISATSGNGGAVRVQSVQGSFLQVFLKTNFFAGNEAGSSGNGNDLYGIQIEGGLDGKNTTLISFLNNVFSDHSGPSESDLHFERIVALFAQSCDLPRVAAHQYSQVSLCQCEGGQGTLEGFDLSDGGLSTDGDVTVRDLSLTNGGITHASTSSCYDNTSQFEPTDYFSNSTLTIMEAGDFFFEAHIYGLAVKVASTGFLTLKEGTSLYVEDGVFTNEGTTNIGSGAYLGDQRNPFTVHNDGLLNFQTRTTIQGDLTLGSNSVLSLDYPAGVTTSPEDLAHVIGFATLDGANEIELGGAELTSPGESLVMFWSNYSGSFRSFTLATHTSKTSATERYDTEGLYVRIEKNHEKGGSAGAVAAIVIGTLILLSLLLGGIGYYFIKNRRVSGYEDL